jgi:hypothetical protein
MQTEVRYYPRTLEDLANPEVGDAQVAHIHSIKVYRGKVEEQLHSCGTSTLYEDQ